MTASESSPRTLTAAAAAQLVLGLTFFAVSGAGASRTALRSLTAVDESGDDTDASER